MLHFTRRRMLERSSLALGALILRPTQLLAQTAAVPSNRGAIAGEPTAARIGRSVLDSGGTAVDAILSAALVAAVVSPNNCGIGGYGGHMIFALAKTRKIGVIDFNSLSPARLKPDTFQINENGTVRGRLNERGWLAAGVPGTIAGIELAARRYATRTFAELLAPAIALADEGFPVGKNLVSSIRSSRAGLEKDPASAKLYLPNGNLPEVDSTFRNRDLAALLRILAQANSVDPFYRGPIARQIAEAFEKNGGLVTSEDLSAYQAQEVEPLELRWNDFSIFTAPLTAGGITALEALKILQTLQPLPPTQKTHARIEALRLAWADRLSLLGDPSAVAVPDILAQEHVAKRASQISMALKERKPIATSIDLLPDSGTVNLSCCDGAGNLAALTLTHGNNFGAQVTVPGLGLTLGHGISRFNPRPGHPNSVGPRKRPLHNMCPTIVARNGTPVFAVGGAGGRKIPNAIFDVLLHYIESDGSSATALEGARCHTVGNLKLTLEARWPESDKVDLKSIGYEIQTGGSALVSAATFDPDSRTCRAGVR
jgi:gamma-glutamyltranspeptidase / glutathione hydrolase